MQPGAKRPPSSLVQATSSIGRRGGDAGLAQRLDRLQPGDHAPDAVEPPARRLAVHVAAGQHGGEAGLAALHAEEEVVQRVDGGSEADGFAPGDEQAAGLAVEGGEAGAVDAGGAVGAGDGAEAGHLHQAVPLAVLAHRGDQVRRDWFAHALAPQSW